MKTKLLILLICSGYIMNAQILSSNRRLATENEIIMLELTYGNENLKEVLWYISDPIEIQREIDATKVPDMKALMEKGKVKVSGGKVYELAQFTNGSTALYEYKKDNMIAVRYEQGDGRYLEFELGKPVSQDVRYYNIKYEEKDGNKYVNYAGEKWQLIIGSYVKLEYKADVDFDARVKKTKIRGLNKDGSERQGIIKKITGGND